MEICGSALARKQYNIMIHEKFRICALNNPLQGQNERKSTQNEGKSLQSFAQYTYNIGEKLLCLLVNKGKGQ